MKKFIIILVSALCFICNASADNHFRVEVSGDFKNIDNISFPTPEGIHSFSIKPADAQKYLDMQDETEAFFFKAFHNRKVIGDNNSNASAEVIDSILKINFFGRRTGRPYVLTVSLNQKNDLLIGKLTHVSSSFSPECATLEHMPETSSEAPLNRAPATSRELTLAVDADYLFYKKFKTNGLSSAKASRKAKNSIRSVINQVNSIYSSQLGIVVKINSLKIDTKNERSISSNNSSSVLEAFRFYTVKDQNTVRSDIYHLFTNNSLNGSVVGLAYVGATCRSSLGNYAFGLTKLTNPAVQALVTAHEIAHNLGATHIDGTNSIMSPYLTAGKNQFVIASLDQIFGFIQQYGACLASVA